MEQAGATLDRPAERQASPVHPEEQASWSARPAVALMLRVAIFTAPIVASVLASFLVARRWPRPDGLGASLGWLCVLIVIGGIAMVAIDRVARRFLPLAALLRMTLIFPDQAPNRFNVAIRSGTTKQLERRRSTCNLAGLQLVGVDLTGADLSFADLRGTRLTNSNLDGATLARADLRGAILVDVTMRGVSAPKIDARTVNWERVDISGSTLTAAVFSDGRFVDVSFASIAATGVEFERARLDTVRFNDAGLQESTFESAVLIDVKMQRVRAHASNFEAADASGIDLTNADVRESEMPTANLSNAILSGARIGSAALGETNFRFATGTPVGAASAEFGATICPDGSVRSSTCWP